MGAPFVSVPFSLISLHLLPHLRSRDFLSISSSDLHRVDYLSTRLVTRGFKEMFQGDKLASIYIKDTIF